MEQTIIGTPVLAPVSPAHLRALHPLVVVELIIIGTPTHALANIMSPPPHLVLHPQRGVEPINIGIVIPARVNHTQVVLPAALPQMAAGQDIIGIPHTATVNQKDPRPVLLHPPVANQIIIGIPRLALVNLTLLPVILHQRAVDLTNIGIVILARVNHTQVVLQPVTLLRKVALTIITGIHIPARVDRLIQHVILHQTVADQTITGIITIAATGCGYNYYWDSPSCTCKPNPNITPCTAPVSGCGTNSYWDSYSCSCKNYYPYYQQENYDRLAYESSERITCVKNLLNQYEFDRLRYFIPTSSQEQEEIYKLGDKVKSCWGYTSESSTGTTSQTAKPPIENEACLLEKLGETAYKDIYYGVRQPTHEEHLLFEKCYGKTPVSSVTYYTSDTKLSKEVDGCLRYSLGSSYSKVKAGQIDVPYEQREQVNRCFGVNPQPFEEGRVYKIPDDIKSCLQESIGEARFNEISSGGSNPSDEEKKKGETCFAELHKDQLKFLPPPPEQVPFLETDPNVIGFANFKQETKKVKNTTIGGKVTFEGKGPPNTPVYIYIYSEPIVITTKTDENGEWVYELNQPLKGEKHVAYATVKDTSGKIVRSSVFDFTVVAANEKTVQLLQEEVVSEKEQNRFIKYAAITLAVGLILVVVLQIRHFLRFSKKLGVNKDSSSGIPGKGESKDNTGSGSVD